MAHQKAGVAIRLTSSDAELLRRTCIEQSNILSNSSRIDDMTTEARLELLKAASRLSIIASMIETSQ